MVHLGHSNNDHNLNFDWYTAGFYIYWWWYHLVRSCEETEGQVKIP